MINITPIAQTKLEEYLKENNLKSGIRIYLAPGCCSGASLALTLDEVTENDLTAQFGELQLIIDRALSSQVGEATVDFKDEGWRSGFVVASENMINQDAMGCDSCSSCG